ncbi:vascular endothelial growth factor A-like [Pseudomyrmex gracilis]|uniref:vascular endothelial growth factor A-like n=1 Tax=Pseudomyrmex gracilis TaxID=219809 RepID=UPI00099545BA|nr:vascular endothelial growth factor A-like [Pseudomyrmex gracilis]
MKFLEIVCVLLITRIYSTVTMLYEDGEMHEMQEIGCSGKARFKQLKNHIKHVTCTPRDTVVKLLSKIPGTVLFPNYAIAKRCGGFCPHNKSCVGVEKVNITIPIKVFTVNSPECHHVYVEQHTKCRCQCSVEKSDCNMHQVYSEDNCACECVNRKECNRSRRMVWDENVCRCTCNQEEICSSGLEWVPARCGCAKVMEMPYSNTID